MKSSNYKDGTKSKRILSVLVGTTLAMSSVPAMTASAITIGEMQSSWSQKIQAEKNKYPEMVDGKQCYWNNPRDPEKYTFIPCVHNSIGEGSCCGRIIPEKIYDETYTIINESNPQYPTTLEYMQCIGFAVKLAEDIYDKAPRIRHNLKVGYYKTKDGASVKYVPKAGDIVRLLGHSIFITSVNTTSGEVKFAQCNAPTRKNAEGKWVGDCAIDWDATKFEGITFNMAYLQNIDGYFERTAIVGDLNLDEKVDSKDVTIFKNTLYAGKSALNNTPEAAYDMNQDGVVDDNDWVLIQGGANISTSQLRIVNKNTPSVCWNALPDGAFNYSNGYYIKNDNGGVSFFGVRSTICTSFNIPSRVYCSADNTYYTVTEVGYPTEGQPIVQAIKNLTSVTVPATIRKIHDSAFYGTNLQNFNFANTPTALTEIGNGAFYGTKLSYFNFSVAKNLKNIGNYAFANTAITQADLSQNTALETIGNNAFQGNNITSAPLPYSLVKVGDSAFEDCTKLTNVTVKANQYNSCKIEQFGANAFSGCNSLQTVTIAEYYRSLIVGNNGIGAFDVNSAHKVTLTVPNNSSQYKGIYLHGNDSTEFKNSYLIIKGGRVNVYGCTSNSNSTLIASKSSIELTTVSTN